MTDEPKALVVPPMPEVWDPLKTTCYDDRKKWIDYARQLAEIAQVQVQRADEAEQAGATLESACVKALNERDALKARIAELKATLANRGSVYVTDGHGALWGTPESITWVTDELDRLESTLAQRDREVLALRSALERVVSRFAPVKHEFIFSRRNALEKAESILTSTADATDGAAILGTESGEAQP